MIELKSVTKKYGKHTIVRDVNCIYENGKVYGLIGYNGKDDAFKDDCRHFPPGRGRDSGRRSVHLRE